MGFTLCALRTPLVAVYKSHLFSPGFVCENNLFSQQPLWSKKKKNSGWSGGATSKMALSLTWQGPLSLHHTDYPRGSLGNLIAWWLASHRASGTRKHAGSYNVFYDLDLEVILHYFCKIMSVTQAALVSAGGTYPGLQITGCCLQGWLLSLPHLLPVEAKITRHLREKKETKQRNSEKTEQAGTEGNFREKLSQS